MDRSGTGDILVYDRRRAEITGVIDVLEFSPSNVTLSCAGATLSVDGSELKIESFDSGSGRLALTGNIDGFLYYGESETSKRTKRRLFG